MNRSFAITLSTAIAAALSLAAVPGLADDDRAPPQQNAVQIIQQVEAAGFRDIRDVEFDDGLWQVDATAPDGQRVELHIDPATNEILDPRTPPALTAADIAARLASQGFTDVHDVEFDDGRYEAEARDRDGRRVDLTVHPGDGRVLSSRFDD